MTLETMKYWEKSVPMGFKDKEYSYEEKRAFRYGLQNYMHEAFRFDSFKDKLVLDLGCGAGIDSAEFARNGAKIVSVDFAKEAVRLTRSLFKEMHMKGHIIRASATHLPFQRDVFDCVYSFGVVHHIPDADSVFEEILRILKSNGKFLGMLYNENSLLHAMLLLRAWQAHKRGQLLEHTLEQIVPQITERIFGCPYTKLYSEDEARELLSRYFQNVEVYPQYNVIDTENERKLKFSIQNGCRELGWHLVVKGDKP